MMMISVGNSSPSSLLPYTRGCYKLCTQPNRPASASSMAGAGCCSTSPDTVTGREMVPGVHFRSREVTCDQSRCTSCPHTCRWPFPMYVHDRNRPLKSSAFAISKPCESVLSNLSVYATSLMYVRWEPVNLGNPAQLSTSSRFELTQRGLVFEWPGL